MKTCAGLQWQEEAWESLREELPTIYAYEHLPETARFAGKMDAGCNVAQYDALAASGCLLAVTGRTKEGELAAYYLGLLTTFPGNLTPLCMSMVYYVRGLWREQGHGRQLFREVEFYARQHGIACISAVSKLNNPRVAMLERWGFEPDETIFLKWIGE